MNDFIIRKATAKDIPEMQRLQTLGDLLTAADEVFEADWFIPYIKKGITLVATAGGKTIGYIMGEYLVGNGAISWFTVVDTEYRNGMVALGLFNEFKRIAAAHGVTWILSYVLKDTVPLHQRLGAHVEKHDFKEVLYYLDNH